MYEKNKVILSVIMLGITLFGLDFIRLYEYHR